MTRKDEIRFQEDQEDMEETGEEINSNDIDRALEEAQGESENDVNKEELGIPDRELGEVDEETETDDTLKDELKRIKEEAKDNHDRYLRTLAEFENFKKRIIREKEDYLKYANEELIKQILPIVDNLERAIMHSNENSDSESVIEGVEMIHNQLLETLGKFGVSPVEAIDKPFDPNFHEAMMQVETDESPPNTVVTEIARGYTLNDRLLRPSLVAVSKSSTKDGHEEETRSEDDD